MLHKWELTIPTLSPDHQRNAYIYLPREYEENPEKRFPVLYMFDGHNVFLDSDATYGTSWGMYEYMNESETPLIIVAVACNKIGNRRLIEYSPFNHTTAKLGHMTGLGRTYMEWLTGTLKPQIDAQYRTLPGRENTLIAGSSMGGLMSLYAVCDYNHVFSRAACLSPSLWVGPWRVRRMIRRARFDKDTCIYMDYGREELRNHRGSLTALRIASQTLLARGVDITFRIVPNGRHCEASWAKQVPVFMKCLGL